MRLRKLMLPPFHGERMRAYEATIAAAARSEIATWPRGREFPLRERMQAITLEVILTAVFGVAEGPRHDELRDLLSRVLAQTRRSLSQVVGVLTRPLGRLGPYGPFQRLLDRTDALLAAEIAERRRDPALAEREDILSMLVAARFDDGSELSDDELRDQLMTLLVAGHETTATALAWAFDLLLHHPATLERARAAAAEGDDAYIDAVGTEAQRIRPVITSVGRTLGTAGTYGGHELPAGTSLMVSTYLLHTRPDLYPDPYEFRPERFTEGRAETYSWLPFGGGIRRCIGAAFAQLEMRVVLREVLGAVELRAAAARGRAGDPLRNHARPAPPGQGARLAVIATRLAAVLIAVAASLAVAAPASADQPFEGDASWIWYVSESGGSGAAIGREADRRGLDAVYVKSADGTSSWSQFTPGLVGAIHDRGVDVCGWQYVYGEDPKREARAGARAAEAGADCLIIDAEAQYEGRYAAAETYLRVLRKRVGADYPLALSSFPYVDYHPAFPYSVFLGPGGADYNLPQIYWYTIGDPVESSIAHTYSWNRGYGRAIHPVGQTYDNPPGRQLRQFRRYAGEFEAGGVSWWSWQETAKGEWRAITRRVSPGVKGFEAPHDFADLARGDEGDLVIRAQQLLAGAGYETPINGSFDRRTERAVVDLQESEGIPAGGEIGDRTWAVLLESEAEPVNWSRRGNPRTARLPALRYEIPAAVERTR